MEDTSLKLTPTDLYKICGFLGLDKSAFAQQLGVTLAYLSRVLNGKNKLTVNLENKALQLLEDYIRAQPKNLLVQIVRDTSLQSLSTEERYSMSFLRKALAGFSLEELSILRQNLRSYKFELKYQLQKEMSEVRESTN